MTAARFALVIALFVVGVQQIYGHGKMTDPMNRSSVWRLNRFAKVLVNNEDNENFCGGYAVQHNENGGNCGPCGDNYVDPVPRNNENGGIYGEGHIVRRYQAGQRVKVVVDLSANHLGFFQFSICELKNNNDVETEECFDKNPLKIVDKSGELVDRHPIIAGQNGDIELEVELPKSLKCERCVFRWHYSAGNNWGFCNQKTLEGRMGCGPQETFRSCADVSIHR
ncbi:uncharacterized protein LOC100118004 [Nasonia vitripennis]|uniref:Chitin-binding type-4 domain-containing protein n=1 Tax=Nasonia vitripennis TaxID=7425 RepID=A0A7M7G3Y9_NASVI|nr:uncharacterized protein LOC100118004 [Nasonia vitripennis]